MTIPRAAAALLLLAAAAAAGAGEARAADDLGQVLVLDQPRRRADAERMIRDYERHAEVLDRYILRTPGYPVVEDSGRFRGLRPGHWLPMLGACEQVSPVALAAVRAFFPRAKVLTLEEHPGEETCPRPPEGVYPGRFKPEPARALLRGEGRTLWIGLAVELPERPLDDDDGLVHPGVPTGWRPDQGRGGRDVPRSRGATYVLQVLDDASGAVLDVLELAGPERRTLGMTRTGPDVRVCTAQVVQGGEEAILERSCRRDLAGCETSTVQGRYQESAGRGHRARAWTEQIHVTIRAGGIGVQSRRDVVDLAPCAGD